MSDDGVSAGSDSQEYRRDTQSQFVPQEDDAEVLWEVIEITGEKSRFYKVRWAGLDPQTGKPWAQSWVAKRDCTDNLVAGWKRKQALKKKKEEAKANKRNSLASKKSRGSAVSRVSAVSSGSTASSFTTLRRNTRHASATTQASKPGKRTHSAIGGSDDEHLPVAEVLATPARSSKKRRLDVSGQEELRSLEVRRGGKTKRVSRETDEEDAIEQPPRRHVEPDGHAVQTTGRTPVKEEEESSEEEKRSPLANSHTAKSKKIARTNYPPTQRNFSASATHPAYVKYKSGKIASPKKRRSSQSTGSSPSSSSSDEVDAVIPHFSPRRYSPVISQQAMARLREFDQEMRETEEAAAAAAAEQTMDHMYEQFVDFNGVPSSSSVRVKSRHRASNGTSKAEDDSYRQGIVPETETEQSQSQSELISRLRPGSPPESPQAHNCQPQPSAESESEMPESPVSSSYASLEPPRTQPQSEPSGAPTVVPPEPHLRVSLKSKMKPRTGSSARLSSIDHDLVVTDLTELGVTIEVDQDEGQSQEVDGQSLQGEEKGSQKRPLAKVAPRSRSGTGALRPIPMISPSKFTPHLPKASSSSTVSGIGVRRLGATGQDDEHNAEEEALENMSSIEQFSSPEKGGPKRGSSAAALGDRGKGKARAKSSEAVAEASVTDNDDDDVDGADLNHIVRERGQVLAERARQEQKKRQCDVVGETNKRTLLDLLSADVKGKNRERREEKERQKMNRLRLGSAALEARQEKDREIERRKETERECDAVAWREEEESTQDVMAATRQWTIGVDSDMDMDVAFNPGPTAGHTAEFLGSNDLGFVPIVPVTTSPRSEDFDQAPVTHVQTLVLLEEKERENTALKDEIGFLRQDMVAATKASQSQTLRFKAELAEAQASLDTALASLAGGERTVADLARGKESAEKDREFFREQYTKASGFVTSVREENKELEQQVHIAKEQATAGVEMVKATFAARTKALEEDLKHWRRIATFMMEKDVRTNDDIRRRAAEEPELRLQCERLEEENLELRELYDSLQEDMQDRDAQVRDLEGRLKHMTGEVCRLDMELGNSEGLDRDEEDASASSTDMLYRCQWRSEGSNTVCDGLFPNIQELEDHMYQGGHLHV